MNFIRSIIAAWFGRAAEQNRKHSERQANKAKSRAVDDVTPLIATAAILGATSSTPGGKNGEMNEGDVHSGPDGYSPNTGYPDTFYGGGDFAGGDFGGGGDAGGSF
ncbi:MAG: hypothetical protein RLZ88_886 [Actinomycetota bacterium]|jgi:hypothetical protein